MTYISKGVLTVFLLMGLMIAPSAIQAQTDGQVSQNSADTANTGDTGIKGEEDPCEVERKTKPWGIGPCRNVEIRLERRKNEDPKREKTKNEDISIETQ